jgi:hypothetical protein
MTKLVTLIVAIVLSISTTGIVFAKNPGGNTNTNNNNNDASTAQYGCQNGAQGSHCSEQTQPRGSHTNGSHNSHPAIASQGSHSSYH